MIQDGDLPANDLVLSQPSTVAVSSPRTAAKSVLGISPIALLLGLGAIASGCDDVVDADQVSVSDGESSSSQHVFVAREGDVRAYDAASGLELPGAIQDVTTPVDMKALANGVVGVNLTTRGEALFFDSRTMLELGSLRPHTSNAFGVRPVHSYLTPDKRYWLAMNDGVEGRRETNSAGFIDIDPESPTYLELVGEVALGVGHHKAAFSTTEQRVVISNIADCLEVMGVYDYSNLRAIRPLAILTGEEAGFDAPDPLLTSESADATITKSHGGVSPQVAASIEEASAEGRFDKRFCDPSYERGLPPAPHGCATSNLSGKAYCNLTNSGEIVTVDLDADPPTFDLAATQGLYGGFTLAHPGGRYVYSLQEAPREGNGGEHCQIGQLVVIDGADDSIALQMPLGYYGTEPCEIALVDTPAETAQVDHLYFSPDGDRLYLPTAGGFDVTDARVNQLLVLDTSDPRAPVQLESLEVGVHTGHSSASMSADGRWLFVVHSVDGSVSKVDLARGRVALTMKVQPGPLVVTAFDRAAGPAY